MKIFQKIPNLMQTAEGKKVRIFGNFTLPSRSFCYFHNFQVVKNYNKLAEVLIAFEMLYHRAWNRQVTAAKTGLKASLLIRHPETKKLFVNLDPDILTLVRETEIMGRLNMDIPLAAQHLRLKHHVFKDYHDRLTVSAL